MYKRPLLINLLTILLIILPHAAAKLNQNNRLMYLPVRLFFSEAENLEELTKIQGPFLSCFRETEAASAEGQLFAPILSDNAGGV